MNDHVPFRAQCQVRCGNTQMNDAYSQERRTGYSHLLACGIPPPKVTRRGPRLILLRALPTTHEIVHPEYSKDGRFARYLDLVGQVIRTANVNSGRGGLRPRILGTGIRSENTRSFLLSPPRRGGGDGVIVPAATAPPRTTPGRTMLLLLLSPSQAKLAHGPRTVLQRGT
jgi:hypothetical protein